MLKIILNPIQPVETRELTAEITAFQLTRNRHRPLYEAFAYGEHLSDPPPYRIHRLQTTRKTKTLY